MVSSENDALSMFSIILGVPTSVDQSRFDCVIKCECKSPDNFFEMQAQVRGVNNY